MDSVGSGIYRFANEAFVRLIILVAVLFLHAYAIAQEPKSRAAIPDEAAQKTALAVVAEVYKPDYEKAKTPLQKVELAKKLLTEGTATKDDATGRFVLFRMARDIAAQQGDLATAFTAIGCISGEFEIDRMQMQLDAATTAAKAPKLAKEHQTCAALLTPVIDEAIAVDRYEHARSFAELALSCARDGKDFDRIRQLGARSKEIEEIAAEFKNVAEAKVALDSKPTDPDANFAVGKFLCMIKGDWRRGVTMLALSSNEEFKAAALIELEAKPDSLKLGDAWWKIAESQEGGAKTRTQAHASEWYRKSLPALSGLTKAKVETRLKEVDAQNVADSGKPDAAPPRQSPFVGKWRTPAGNIIQISDNGIARHLTGSGLMGKWTTRGRDARGRLIYGIAWDSGVVDAIQVSDDGKTAPAQSRRENGKIITGEWKRE